MFQSITFSPSAVTPAKIEDSELVNTLTSCSKYVDNKNSGNIFQASNLTPGLRTEGLVNLLTRAYSYHHKLVIRPEDIWMAIQTQFCFYVNKYPEELRTKFVNHEGKQDLVVTDLEFNTKDLGKLSVGMTEKMTEFLKTPELINWILPKFSTTTHQDTCAFAVLSMGTLQNYFTYKFELCCGLPEVTVLGTVEDWHEIKDRCATLLCYELNNKNYMRMWYDMLIPVLEKFIETVRGAPDFEWWNKVCHKYSGGSGPSYLSGWVTVFNVFSNEGDWLGSLRSDSWRNVRDSEWPLVNTNDIASCYTAFKVKVNNDGDEFEAIMYAGIYGASVKRGDTLIPRIEWGICRQLTDAEADERIAIKEAENKKLLEGRQKRAQEARQERQEAKKISSSNVVEKLF
jgi:hypothetical protein